MHPMGCILVTSATEEDKMASIEIDGDEICYCENEDCKRIHIEDEPATYDFWFKGEYHETVASEDTPAAVISEIKQLAETPDEYGDWIVKNKVTKEKLTFTEFLAKAGA
jgi:hypothetical protein